MSFKHGSSEANGHVGSLIPLLLFSDSWSVLLLLRDDPANERNIGQALTFRLSAISVAKGGDTAAGRGPIAHGDEVDSCDVEWLFEQVSGSRDPGKFHTLVELANTI